MTCMLGKVVPLARQSWGPDVRGYCCIHRGREVCMVAYTAECGGRPSRRLGRLAGVLALLGAALLLPTGARAVECSNGGAGSNPAGSDSGAGVANTAVGASAVATGSYSSAIGAEAEALAANSIAIGGNAAGGAGNA